MIICGNNKVSITIAVIYIESDTIKVKFPERLDKFNSMVKNHGFAWSRPYWIREVSGLSLPARERCIELCYHLVDAGFVVDAPDELVNDIVNANFEPEQKRWIKRMTSGDYQDWFAICYPYGDDFYNESRRITGSEYCKPRVVVPKEQYAEILDFAEIHGFKLTPAAIELVEIAKLQEDDILIVSLKPIREKQKEIEATDRIPDELLDQNC